VAKYSFYFGSYPGRGKVERISGSEDRRTDVKKQIFIVFGAARVTL